MEDIRLTKFGLYRPGGLPVGASILRIHSEVRLAKKNLESGGGVT